MVPPPKIEKIVETSHHIFCEQNIAPHPHPSKMLKFLFTTHKNRFFLYLIPILLQCLSINYGPHHSLNYIPNFVTPHYQEIMKMLYPLKNTRNNFTQTKILIYGGWGGIRGPTLDFKKGFCFKPVLQYSNC